MAEESEVYALPFRRYTLRKMGVSARHARVIRVIGNSMAPWIRSGDIAAIDTNNTAIESGHLYAVQEAGLIRVRKLHIMEDIGVCIECFNSSEYPLEGLTDSDFNARFTVLGRVFWSSRLW